MTSWLFVPGNEIKHLNKISNLSSDYFILDLEDAVPLQEKPFARKNILEYLNEKQTHQNIFIRINSITSGLYIEDLNQVDFSKILGVVISKVESREDIDLLVKYFPIFNKQIIPLIESLKGYNNLETILQHPMVTQVAFGAVDMANELLIRDADVFNNPLLNMMRMNIVMLSKKFNKYNPIDAPYINIIDVVRLKQECEYARKLGFSGKLAIHPKQIKIIQQSFSYTEEEIAFAHEVIQIFENNKKHTIAYKDIMIDEPVYLKMKKIIDQSH